MSAENNAAIRTDAPLVPSYVRNWNAFAEDHGLVTRTCLERRDDGEVLLAEWAGSVAQLAATGLLTATQHGMMQFLTSATRQLIVPRSEVWWRHPLLRGHVTTNGALMRYEIDFGPPTLEISQEGALEVLRWSDALAYHGSAEALLAVGIERKRLPLGKRRCRSCLSHSPDAPYFACNRQPDGSYLYWRESDAAFARRKREDEESRRRHCESLAHYAAWLVEKGSAPQPQPKPPKPSHLRLVVNNAPKETQP